MAEGRGEAEGIDRRWLFAMELGEGQVKLGFYRLNDQGRPYVEYPGGPPATLTYTRPVATLPPREAFADEP